MGNQLEPRPRLGAPADEVVVADLTSVPIGANFCQYERKSSYSCQVG